MGFTDRYFSGSVIDEGKLIAFGFKKAGGSFVYSREFMNGAFRAEIVYRSGECFSGKVIDLSSEEEYLPLFVEGAHGEYVGKVRDSYELILEEIRESCTTKKRYRNAQAERIAIAIEERYGSSPEWLWGEGIDDPSVFRHRENSKWFGIIMYVPYSKFGSNNPGGTNVINVKLKPAEITALLGKQGYEKAYHMNKKFWLSILLDDSLDDEEILRSIGQSFMLTRE